MKLAVFDDSRSQATVIKALLLSEGFEISAFTSWPACEQALRDTLFDLVIVGAERHDNETEARLTALREQHGWQLPIVCCVGQCDEVSAARLLTLGADDVVAKPIRYMEFMARVSALIRRCKGADPHVITQGKIVVDLSNKMVTLAGAVIDLTQREFELVSVFFANIGRLLSRDELLRRIWETDATLDSRTVDTHTSRIRRKLKLDGAHGLVLTSVYGQGYRLDPVQLT